MEPIASPGRRWFLAGVIQAVGALYALMLAVPTLGAFLGSVFKRRPDAPWIDFGSVQALEVGVPRLLTTESQERDAWYQGAMRRAVWVVRGSAAGGYTVFAPRCTHLGCAYRWDAATNQFACPCHGGTYAISGQVTGGPPPRPLDRLPSKVENDVLYVQFVPPGTVA